MTNTRISLPVFIKIQGVQYCYCCHFGVFWLRNCNDDVKRASVYQSQNTIKFIKNF